MSYIVSKSPSRLIYTIVPLIFFYLQNISAYDYYDDFDEGAGAFRKGDYETAAKKFLIVAEKGDPRGIYALGSMYAGGIGVEQNFKESYKWLNESAKRNRPQAQYKVGLLHYAGLGVPQNYKKAALFFNKAANEGYPPAQYRLGLLYEKGQVVEQSNVQAYAWLITAAQYYNPEQLLKSQESNETGQIIAELATVEELIENKFAKDHLKEMLEVLKRISAEMTPGQLEEVKHLAQKYIQYRKKYQLLSIGGFGFTSEITGNRLFKKGVLPTEDENLFMPEIFHE